MTKLAVCLLAGLSLVAMALTGCGTSAPPRKKVTIVATGFLKGSLLPFSKEYSRKRTRTLGGFAHLAGRVNELVRATPPENGIVLVDLGNHMSGSLESYVTKGQIVVELMNKLPYAAALLNNMEFTYGQPALSERVAQAKFSYLSSNATFEDAGLKQKIKDHTITTAAGLKIAILAQTPENLVQICAPEVVKGVRIAADLAELCKRAAELKSREGADVVVLLSKLSVDNPPADVRKLITDSQIDLVLGIDYSNDGDRMTTWGKTVATGLPGDNRGARVKLVELTFDDSKKIVGSEAQVEVISPEVNPADPEVDKVLTGFKADVMAKYEAKIGTVVSPLTKGWREEATLGDLIADSMRAATKADLAVINSGAIQDELAAGDVALKDLYRAVPFDNNVVTLSLTGAQLKEAIAAGLAGATTFQVSGMSYRARELPGGSVQLTQLTVGGKDIDPAKTFQVAITDFTITRMEPLKGQTGVVKDTVRNLLQAAIKAQSPLDRKADNRVIFDKLPTKSN